MHKLLDLHFLRHHQTLNYSTTSPSYGPSLLYFAANKQTQTQILFYIPLAPTKTQTWPIQLAAANHFTLEHNGQYFGTLQLTTRPNGLRTWWMLIIVRRGWNSSATSVTWFDGLTYPSCGSWLLYAVLLHPSPFPSIFHKENISAYNP